MAIYSIKRGCQFGRISRLPLFFLLQDPLADRSFCMRIEGVARHGPLGQTLTERGERLIKLD